MSQSANSTVLQSGNQTSKTVQATPFEVGKGFSARQFRHKEFDGLMDPLLMVDDYTMTEPTFGTHPHAGIAAVSLLFEESRGEFFNHDSLGNHLALGAGDLYWLNAGRGAMHDESPLPGAARIRGLQIFVKLSAHRAAREPSSQHVPAASIPVLSEPGLRVRVAAGETQGIRGYQAPEPVTLLDGRLDGGSRFAHDLETGQSVWVYAEEGELTIKLEGEARHLQAGQAVAVQVDEAQQVEVSGVRHSHFVLIAANPHREPFVQEGPFALASEEEVAQARQDAKAGRMGTVEHKAVSNAR